MGSHARSEDLERERRSLTAPSERVMEAVHAGHDQARANKPCGRL